MIKNQDETIRMENDVRTASTWGIAPLMRTSLLTIAAVFGVLAATSAMGGDLAASEIALVGNPGHSHSEAITQDGQFKKATPSQQTLLQWAQVRQNGANNQLQAVQSGQINGFKANQNGSDNLTLITQSGSFNAIDTNQHGTANIASVAQTGTRNMAFIDQFGNGNRADVSQSSRASNAAVRQYGDRSVARVIQY